MTTRVLIVDDDDDAAETLHDLLRGEGYDLARVASGCAGLNATIGPLRPELLFIESELPDMKGTELCRRIRQGHSRSRVPIVILSRYSEDIDQIVAFELGADDYITRPYDPREFVLRIKAILRRCYAGTPSGRQLREGPLRLDLDARRVWLRSEALELARIEFHLLEVLMSRRGRAQTRKGLLQDVWGHTAEASGRTVDTHIRRLREKLGSAASNIRTIRGVGYCFGDPEERGD